MSGIGIVGAGAFGTALAVSLARAGRAPLLWARDADHAAAMQADRRNDRRLPDIDLPADLRITADPGALAECDALLLAVPMQKLRAFCDENRAVLDRRRLVACCKGVSLDTLEGPVTLLQGLFPDAHPAILTGPSFAHDIARGLPTALTLACTDAATGWDLQERLTTDNLRLYRSGDIVGAELGGALKNVMAIACGAAIGAGLGTSARAALITRGYAEMQRFAVARGASPETLAGLSGFGDLALTCTSDGSRNYRLGLSIGQGTAFDPGVTVEGAATARAVDRAAREARIEMPITYVVARLLDRMLDVPEAMDILLRRPLKKE